MRGTVYIDAWTREVLRTAMDEIAHNERHINLALVLTHARQAGCGVVVDQLDGTPMRARIDSTTTYGSLHYRELRV